MNHDAQQWMTFVPTTVSDQTADRRRPGRPRGPGRPLGRPAGAVEQDMEMIALFGGGATLQEIGDRYGICRERVRQRLHLHGVTAADGGRSFKKQIHAEERWLARDARYLARYGHDYATHKRIGSSVLQLFNCGRAAARRQRVPWELTFQEWVTIWERSGKWDERARIWHGYVLGRLDKTRGFSVDNVAVMTLAENSAETQIQVIERGLTPGVGKKALAR